MTNEQFAEAVKPLYESQPYQPFLIELYDGTWHELECARALGYRDGSVTFITRGRGPRFLMCADFRQVIPATAEKVTA